MGKQMTEMLKGTLEGIVLALLAGQSAYGYEITARLREQGFTDIVEGTVYALLVRIEQRGLVDVEKVPSEKGPPRKVYSLNARARTARRSSGGRGASSRNGSNSSAQRRREVTWPRSGSRPSPGRSSRRSSTSRTRPASRPCPSRTAGAAKAFERYFMYYGGITDGDTMITMLDDFADLWERAAARRDAGARDRRRRPGRVRRGFAQAYAGKQWIDKERARLTEAIEAGRARERRHEHARTAIRVQGLEKSFKDLHVLRGVDFDVARGSIFALLGSNGAGKTTVVRILSTLLKADAGPAGVDGFDVATQAGEVRESISLTGQFAAVDEVLTGRENLVLVAGCVT